MAFPAAKFTKIKNIHQLNSSIEFYPIRKEIRLRLEVKCGSPGAQI